MRAIDCLDVVVGLSGNGLRINREVFGAEMEILGPVQLAELVGILEGAGVYCSIGDVIDSVYQGLMNAMPAGVVDIPLRAGGVRIPLREKESLDEQPFRFCFCFGACAGFLQGCCLR